MAVTEVENLINNNSEKNFEKPKNIESDKGSILDEIMNPKEVQG